jgi:hypothetical protein
MVHSPGHLLSNVAPVRRFQRGTNLWRLFDVATKSLVVSLTLSLLWYLFVTRYALVVLGAAGLGSGVFSWRKYRLTRLRFRDAAVTVDRLSQSNGLLLTSFEVDAHEWQPDLDLRLRGQSIRPPSNPPLLFAGTAALLFGAHFLLPPLPTPHLTTPEAAQHSLQRLQMQVQAVDEAVLVAPEIKAALAQLEAAADAQHFDGNAWQDIDNVSAAVFSEAQLADDALAEAERLATAAEASSDDALGSAERELEEALLHLNPDGLETGQQNVPNEKKADSVSGQRSDSGQAHALRRVRLQELEAALRKRRAALQQAFGTAREQSSARAALRANASAADGPASASGEKMDLSLEQKAVSGGGTDSREPQFAAAALAPLERGALLPLPAGHGGESGALVRLRAASPTVNRTAPFTLSSQATGDATKPGVTRQRPAVSPDNARRVERYFRDPASPRPPR